MKELFFSSPLEIFPETIPGIVEMTIAPNRRGRIKFHSSFWPAKLYNIKCSVTVLPGQMVNVIGVEGITLLVVPLGCKKPFSCQNLPARTQDVTCSSQ